MKGAIEDVNQDPLLHLFEVPINNDDVLHRLRFELSKTLKNNDNFIECINPINNKKIRCVMLHQGNSTSTNMKKSAN